MSKGLSLLLLVYLSAADKNNHKLNFISTIDETECGDPEQPTSSVVNRVSKSEVEYSCLKGYRLEAGNRTRTCSKAGAWSGKTPRCIGEKFYLVGLGIRKLLLTISWN